MIRTFTVVGGGSAYAPGLLSAILHHANELPLREIRLYDINLENLEIVTALVDRMAKAAGADMKIHAATNLPDAIRGTDAVLNTARPGGFECRRLDETLPVELGIPGQETVGPGGFFFALRSVPAALELAQTIEREAPHALLFNYTNPTNIVTQAISERVTGISVIGLCDQSDEDLLDLTKALRVPPRFRFSSVGLNHATWYSDIDLDGVSLPSSLAEIAPPPELKGEYRLRFELSVELARAHPGRWPNSYLPYYFAPERFVEEAKRSGPRTDAITAKLPGYFEHFCEEAAKEVPDLRHHRGGEGFGDMAVRALRAVGSPEAEEMVLNIPSMGAAAEFDTDTVVEIVCDLSTAGAIRRTAPPLPEDQRPLLMRLQRYQRATAEVAATQDPSLAIDALTENPLIPSRDVAAAMLDRGRLLYGARIPMFA